MTFGKKLIDHPVIRNKIAHMIRQVEATHAWMESLAYQTMHMPAEIQPIRLVSYSRHSDRISPPLIMPLYH